MTLHIFVADDHEVVRCGICALLTSHSGWEVCGEAGDGREAVEKVAHLKPDIVQELPFALFTAATHAPNSN